MPSKDATRNATKRWRHRNPERMRAFNRRQRMRRRWLREFARMGLSERDLVPIRPNDVPKWHYSAATAMMNAYEGYLARQSHKCIVCRRAEDLTVPVWDVNGVLTAFACEACRVFVTEEEQVK